MRTVQRALSGEAGDIRLESLLALAHALGAELGLVRVKKVRAILRRQARAKARQLAAVAQGSASLEGLAVPGPALRAVEAKIQDKLMSGPAARLWS